MPECPDCGGEGWQPDDGPPEYSRDGEALDEDSQWCVNCEQWFEPDDWDEDTTLGPVDRIIRERARARGLTTDTATANFTDETTAQEYRAAACWYLTRHEPDTAQVLAILAVAAAIEEQ
jgi:hypothetical protein